MVEQIQPIQKPELEAPDTSAKRPRGGRNLMILGIGAIIVTAITTSASLWVYRSTGDIYLDRSRPGYLPDEEEADKSAKASTSFTYGDTGPLDAEELEEYLKELKVLNDRLRALADPYAATPLSDESLGIKPTEETVPADKTSDANTSLRQPTKR